MPIHFDSMNIDRPDFLGGGQWEVSGLNDITVVFGRNGVGKSILLRAIRDVDPDQRHYILPERLGQITSNMRNTQQQRSGAQRKERTSQNFSNDYRTDVFSKIELYLIRRGNIRKDKIPGNPEDLEKLLSGFLPDFKLTIPDDSTPFQITRIETNEQVTNVNQLSSGESEYLTIGLDVVLQSGLWNLEERENPILLIDEPDEHLHPDLQQRFGQFITRVVEEFGIQVIVATHSTTLLAALGHHGGENTSVLYLSSNSKCECKSFNAVLEELTACLGGHVLMGALFGSPLLLVEGDDDMRIWSQVPRHGVIQLGVLPCKGEQIRQYRRTLEQIFSSISSSDGSPLGYALFDGDKDPPQINESDPQDYVPAIQMNCHEAENLYLTDEVLEVLGTDWETAKRDLVEASTNFGEKEQLFNDINEWDRRTHELKPIIGEIARTLDETGLHWTVRVGKKIGSGRPQGQLADFLGTELVNALWGEDISEEAVIEHADEQE